MLIEKVEDLVEKGYSLDDAIDKTVVEFGDADDYEHQPKTKRLRLKNIRHYKNDVIFSVGAIFIIIGILAYINYISSTEILWFVIPGLALLFWPLSTIYRYLNRKSSEGENNNE